jgi:7-cyano-7-deazaguanine synthase in queuosine biosynthesis
MNYETQYTFNFSQPGHIHWTWNRRERQIEVPEEPVTFMINDDAIAREFSMAVDPVLADALDIAVDARMADRLALREQFVDNEHVRCHRRLRITAAVRNPELWNDALIQNGLVETLSFLTQDSWEFKFVKRDFGRKSDAQQHLFGPCQLRDPDVGLFSGGLDSFAGTCIQFAEESRRHFVCVSASPTNIHLGFQRRHFHHLLEQFGQQGTHVSVQYCMRGAAKTLQEPSRRTRGFVFLLLGAVVALSAGSDRLHVYENGIGAINLPYDLSQVGTDTTRAMHPRSLRNVALLVSQVVGRPFAIENRSMFVTKVEMCRHPAVARAAAGIAHTFSCDGLRHSGEHCGFCTSCLLRRHALEQANLAEFDHRLYLNDCVSPEWHPKRRQIRGLLAMTWQASRLRRCLSSTAEWRNVMLEFPELQLAVVELTSERNRPDVPEEIIRLYRKHVADWFNFSALQHLPMQVAA